MTVTITIQAERLNALIQALRIPGQYNVGVSPSGRLLFKKKGMAASKEMVAQALRRVGIVALDSIAGNLRGYQNSHTQLERPNGSIIRKGEMVYFHQFRSEVYGFREIRGSVAVLLAFGDFYIEVDPKKISDSPVVPVATKQERVVPIPAIQPADDCEEARRENLQLRRELEVCHEQVERCAQENIRYREHTRELPKDIVEELPETQVETVTQEIIETVSEIKSSFDTGDKKEAEKQQKHLHELVNELHEKASATTVKATANCIVLDNRQLGGIEIKFPRKPAPETIQAVKAQGFRWNGKSKVWYAKKTDKRMEFAKQLCPDESTPASGSNTPRTTIAPPGNLNVFTHKLYGGEASKKMKSKLREIFPGIRFSVTFDSYAGGSTIHVRTTNISETDEKRIEDVVSRFGGHTWQSDGSGDPYSHYRKGEAFVERGELHQYTVSSSLSVQVDDYSDTDKTSPDYIYHFAETYTDTASAAVVEIPEEQPYDRKTPPPRTEPKIVSVNPNEQLLIEDGVYVHQIFDLSLSVKTIESKLKKIFPHVEFTVTVSNEFAHGYIQIRAKDISSTDAKRINIIIAHFGLLASEGPEDEEAYYPGVPFVENGELHRYDIMDHIYFHVDGKSTTDKTSPDYLNHSSREHLMTANFFVDMDSDRSTAPDSDTVPSEEDFFPAPPPEVKPKEHAEPKVQPDREPEREPTPMHEPPPAPEPPKSDVGAQINSLRELLMAAINKKQGAE